MSDLLNTSQSTIKVFLESDQSHQSISDCTKTFLFENPIQANPGNTMLVQLTDFECPFSWYNVNSTNNTLHNFFTIPAQNYSATELLTQLSSQFAASSITVTYNTQTNKFTFTKASSFTLDMANSTCHRILGFNPTSVLTGTSITSENMVDLLGDKAIYIRLGMNLPNIDSHGADTHIVQKIPIGVAPTEVITYSNESAIKLMITDRHIELLSVSLTDHQDRDLGGGSLNGLLWSMTLAFYFIQDRGDADLLNAPDTVDDRTSQLNQKLDEEE